MDVKVEIDKREKQIKMLLAEIHELKGPQIILCGGCYHKESNDHNCYMVERNGHCPIKVYLSEWELTDRGSYTHRKTAEDVT